MPSRAKKINDIESEHGFNMCEDLDNTDDNANDKHSNDSNTTKPLNNDNAFHLSSDDEKPILHPKKPNKTPDYNLDPDYEDTSPSKKRKRTPNVSSKSTTSIKPDFNDFDFDAEPFLLDDDDGPILPPRPTSTRTTGTFGKRPNQHKGSTLPAYHKRVSHELDSDDELILSLREKGHSDKQIANKLAADGRVRYDAKSISTRIMRIRLAQAERVEFLIKEGYREWEFEDDCLLIQAHALADIEISYETERIRAWRFRKVSEYMRRLNKDALFSENACRERYKALIEGTAQIPSKMADDPDARAAELDAFRVQREGVRRKGEEERKDKEEGERKAREEARRVNAQKAEEAAKRRAEREVEKAERARVRGVQAEVRLKRSLENQAKKEKRNEMVKKRKAELEVKKQKREPLAKKQKTESEVKKLKVEPPVKKQKTEPKVKKPKAEPKVKKQTAEQKVKEPRTKKVVKTEPSSSDSKE